MGGTGGPTRSLFVACDNAGCVCVGGPGGDGVLGDMAEFEVTDGDDGEDTNDGRGEGSDDGGD